jgi:hypothetical protein
MEKQVVFSKDVERYLDELLLLLFEKDYFGFPDMAKSYIDRLLSYVEQHIGIFPNKDAPDVFMRYGQNLKYITYHANKRTTWYIFYQERNNIYLVKYITNNHVSAHYFD